MSTRQGSFSYPAEARVGRHNQVYDENNIRQVTGTIAIDPKTNKILVISSSKHPNVWVLPKGGWENDESKEESAKRETYEEGGVVGTISSFVGSYIDYDLNNKPKSNIWFYLLKVENIFEEWPEKEFRQRRWCTLEEALQLLQYKPIMQKALNDSLFGRDKYFAK